jgi:NAD-reducing hydrogenase large subunit
MMTGANLIVATAHNTLAMNRGLKQVAGKYLSNQSLSEGMLNRMEGLIRSFDPCLSCATHADGSMALVVDLLDTKGNLLQQVGSTA